MLKPLPGMKKKSQAEKSADKKRFQASMEDFDSRFPGLSDDEKARLDREIEERIGSRGQNSHSCEFSADHDFVNGRWERT